MLVLRDLVGVEPLGGVYRAPAGAGSVRGMLRDEARGDLPGFKGTTTSTSPRSGQVREGPVSARASASGSARGTSSRPAGRRVSALVRPVDDVPGAAPVMNQQQLAAVESRGEVFVSAGAGTGKTSVLVERFVRAVCDDGLDVDSVLARSRTRRRRASSARGSAPRSASRGRPDPRASSTARWVSTIHGFCAAFAAHASVRGRIDPRFRELDDEQGAVIRARRSSARWRRSAPPKRTRGCGCSPPTAAPACAGC
jgi:hypothetical protein